jgi:hypothetical protein
MVKREDEGKGRRKVEEERRGAEEERDVVRNSC